MSTKKVFAVAGFFAASVVALAAGNTAAAMNPRDNANCEIGYTASQLGKGFTANSGNTVSYTVIVKGDANCRKDLVMASFKIPHATLQPYPVEEQTLFDHMVIKDATPGRHTLTVKVPTCFHQVDVTRGTNPTGPNGKLPYEGHRMIDAYLGGDKVCKDEPVVVTPTTPVQPAVKTVTTVRPAELPKTGLGSLVGIVAGSSVVAGIAHNVYSRRRLSR